MAFSPDEAVAAAERLGLPVVVKAQVHTGGRGKAGGVKLAADSDEVLRCAADILGLDISGHIVHRLWIEQASDIAEEYYASFTLDRSARKHLGMLSVEGGVEIETVAARDPDAIARIHIDPVDGLSEQSCRQWVQTARIPETVAGAVTDVLVTLYGAYVDADADLVEVNPLIVTAAGDVVLLDSKVTLDANSTFRHDDYATYDATQTRDERERKRRPVHRPTRPCPCRCSRSGTRRRRCGSRCTSCNRCRRSARWCPCPSSRGTPHPAGSR